METIKPFIIFFIDLLVPSVKSCCNVLYLKLVLWILTNIPQIMAVIRLLITSFFPCLLFSSLLGLHCFGGLCMIGLGTMPHTETVINTCVSFCFFISELYFLFNDQMLGQSIAHYVDPGEH